MRKTHAKQGLALLAALCGIALVSLAPQALAQEVKGPKITLKLSLWGKRRAFTEGLEYISAEVNKRTGGNFNIKLYYGEQLSKSKENLDSISVGAIDAALFCAAYHPGKNKPLNVLDLPFLPLANLEVMRIVHEKIYAHPSVKEALAKWNATVYMSNILPQYEYMGKGKPPATIADFKGKRISLGLRGQSDWGVYPRLFLEHAYGITPDNSDIRHMSPGALTQQLIDGATDAAIVAIGAEPNMKEFLIPGLVRQLEAVGKKICYLGVTKKDIEALNKKFQATWIHVNLPPNTLPYQTEPLGIGVNRAFAAVHPTFDTNKAYKVVMAVAKIAPKMKELHALWRAWSPELMTCGLSEENTHPGAIKAFKELGWWEQTKKCSPMTYPKG